MHHLCKTASSNFDISDDESGHTSVKNTEVFYKTSQLPLTWLSFSCSPKCISSSKMWPCILYTCVINGAGPIITTSAFTATNIRSKLMSISSIWRHSGTRSDVGIGGGGRVWGWEGVGLGVCDSVRMVIGGGGRNGWLAGPLQLLLRQPAECSRTFDKGHSA